MYDAILVPIDGSDVAEAALEHALSLAIETDATVHVLFVADTAQDSVTVVGTDVVDALVREGQSVVERAAATGADRDVPVETAVRQGTPAEVIVDYAGEVGVDLVVLGTHGRGGLRRYLLGSVTESVLRTTDVPTLAVGPLDEE